MKEISAKLKDLRQIMAEKGIDAYIINGSDPHKSEYPPPRWETRKFLTGFTGSAGTVVITREKAGLWTDSRYFIQAEKELECTEIELFKTGLAKVPEVTDWLKGTLGKGQIFGSCASTTTVNEEETFSAAFEGTGIEYRPTEDLVDLIWENRPGYPTGKIFQLDVKYCGTNRKEKLNEIRKYMKKEGADWYLISSLSDIAWTTNLRGNDIQYNPVFLSFLLVGMEKCIFFTDKGKISRDLEELLEGDGIQTAFYISLKDYIREIVPGSILLSPETTSIETASLFNDGWTIIKRKDITTLLKAVKNDVEIAGTRSAMVKDGTAMVKFLYWLEEKWEFLNLNEISAAEKLYDFRSRQDGFVNPSFKTIAAFKDHGAIIHYSPVEEIAYPLTGSGLFLVDSGGHYLEGTTDITRVIPLREVTDEMKKDYTLVLMGHIDLALAMFPDTTTGIQLDTIARYPLWQEGKNYLHGTGHGVGHFLTVHEGPQRISTNQPSSILEPGMIVSNEPGYYKEGKYGIRIENLMVVTKGKTTESGNFLKFETLTLCPYERKLIEISLLDTRHIEWINEYHEKVYKSLSPGLNIKEKQWLKEKTAGL